MGRDAPMCYIGPLPCIDHCHDIHVVKCVFANDPQTNKQPTTLIIEAQKSSPVEVMPRPIPRAQPQPVFTQTGRNHKTTSWCSKTVTIKMGLKALASNSERVSGPVRNLTQEPGASSSFCPPAVPQVLESV